MPQRIMTFGNVGLQAETLVLKKHFILSFLYFRLLCISKPAIKLTMEILGEHIFLRLAENENGHIWVLGAPSYFLSAGIWTCG